MTAYNGILCPELVQQFWNQTATQPAAPVGGASYVVYTYLAGTTTPVQTYTDASLGVIGGINTNPVVLNAAGQANIWLNPGTSYKFVYTTSNDTNPPTSPIYTVDNVTPFGASSITQASLGAILYPATANEIAAEITPTYYYYPEGNVLRYGADPSGMNSSFAAVQQAVAVAVRGGNSSGVGGHPRVYFPRGTYKIDQDNVFANPLGSTGFVQRGIVVYGDGLMSSILQLSGTGPLWFFDGVAGEQSYIALKFRDLGFQGDPVGGPAGNSNGFSFFQTQNVIFDTCWFNVLGTGYQDSGTVNGDGTKFSTCRMSSIYTRCFAFNNPNYLNVDVIGCSLEQIYGHIVYVAPNPGSGPQNGYGGGGIFNMVGGDIIMVNGAANTWIVNIAAGANLGNNNNRFKFSAVGISAMGTTCGTVNSLFYGSQSPKITFEDMNFDVQGTARLQVNIAQAHVLYTRCALTQNSGDTYQVNGPPSGGDTYGDPGTLIFDSCDVPINIASQCSTPAGSDTFAWGYISARNCYWSNDDSTVNRITRYVIDFDMNWTNQGRASNPSLIKRAIIKPSNRQWPDATSNFNWTQNFPPGAIIVGWSINRVGGAGGGSYTLQLGNGSNATLYATSSASTAGATQSWGQDYSHTPSSQFTLATSGAYANQLTLSANTLVSGGTSTTGVGTGGYGWVDYI